MPELKPYGNQVATRLKIDTPVYDELKKLADAHSMTPSLMVEHLLAFYNLQYLDIMITKIRQAHEQGLSPIQIAQLSVLYTLLDYIDEYIGLSGLPKRLPGVDEIV